MAITNYAELQAAVLRHLVRDTDTDAALRVPEWIALFEARARRTLTATVGELRVQNVAITGAYNALPADYITHRGFKLLSGEERVLEYMPPHLMDEQYGSQTDANPRYYCIIGNSLRLAPAPSGTIQVEATYYHLPALSDVRTYNWLLLSHPDAYLYGALTEAYDYYADEGKTDRAWTRTENILQSINKSASQFRSRDQVAMRSPIQVV